MVVTHFFAIDDLAGVQVNNPDETILLLHLADENFRAILHLVCQMTVVRSRVSDQLLLVETLRIIQCLLCRESIPPACFSSERGQVI